MPVQPPSLPSTGDSTGIASLSQSHQSESGKTIYWIVFTDQSLFDDAQGTEAATFNGVAMKQWMRWKGADNNFSSALVFSLVDPPVAAGTLLLTAADAANWRGIAFNIEGGAIDGCIILGGAYVNDAASVITRTALAWDENGLQIAAGYAGGSVSVTITGGTEFQRGPGCVANYIAATGGEISFTSTRGASSQHVLLSFLIPSGDQRLAGGGQQPMPSSVMPIGGMLTTDILKSGLPYALGAGQDNDRHCGIFPRPGTIRGFTMKTSAPLGATKQITLELMIAGLSDSITGIGANEPLPTTLSCTIGGASQFKNSVEGDVYGYAYQRFTWRLRNTGSGALPAGITLQVTPVFEHGVKNAQIYGGGVMTFGELNVDTPFRRAPLHPEGDVIWNNFPNSEKSLWGFPWKLDELLVEFQTDVSVTPDHDFYFEVNGIQQDGSSGTIDTKATLIPNTFTRAIARRVLPTPLTIPAVSFGSIVGYLRTGGITLRMAATIAGKTTVPGQFLISGHANNTGTADILAAPNSSREEWSQTITAAVERELAIVAPTRINILGAVLVLETAGPGTNKQVFFYVRKNEDVSGMLPIMLSDALVEGQTGGIIEYVEFDDISVLFDAINSPAATRQFWSLFGYYNPADVIGPLAWVHRTRVVPS